MAEKKTTAGRACSAAATAVVTDYPQQEGGEDPRLRSMLQRSIVRLGLDEKPHWALTRRRKGRLRCLSLRRREIRKTQEYGVWTKNCRGHNERQGTRDEPEPHCKLLK
ncbi:tryptophan--tRNA ligase [Sesbania bispinosa]|nr:tryptophan--tRNA ligase [Sesbania bispinosa]